MSSIRSLRAAVGRVTKWMSFVVAAVLTRLLLGGLYLAVFPLLRLARSLRRAAPPARGDDAGWLPPAPPQRGRDWTRMS